MTAKAGMRSVRNAMANQFFMAAVVLFDDALMDQVRPFQRLHSRERHEQNGACTQSKGDLRCVGGLFGGGVTFLS